ncbi:hypothetical protein R50345_30510 [Paenibacillus sp. FSL R5-0345]|uniref:hypothetical protein n=1 Tax=Paenibacillus sp. FSL R5-0345 TaxID=1536770 RepID=UPI0004F6930F|nr:hypothetical protein [Paenibacillus sp. FSL R5-0345]AIQ38566.1 hypothetical protein R50345_30510 [Paenibacillus sp. FSL R5-0345]
MEKFIKNIDGCIDSMTELNKAWKNTDWNQYDEDQFEKITENYPFHKDLAEIIQDLIKWKEKIKE